MKSAFLFWDSFVRRKVSVTRSWNTCSSRDTLLSHAAAMEAQTVPVPTRVRSPAPCRASLWGCVSQSQGALVSKCCFTSHVPPQ